MALVAGWYPIGPQTGPITINTTRDGMAKRAGHDLTITFEKWNGQLVIADDPAQSSVEATIETGSLAILSGTGGVRELTSGDRSDITKTARRLLKADERPRASFISTAARPQGTGGSLSGTLELAGRSADVTLSVSSTGDTSWQATGEVLQSALGIKPYSAFFGSLKLADAVRITADVRIAGSASA